MIETQMKKETKESLAASAVDTYTFIREEGRWFIHLPEYTELGYNSADLEMVDGAHKLLNSISCGRNRLIVRISTEAFDGADVLELVELCEGAGGGAFYRMSTCNGIEVNTTMWICDIPLFIFGDMPPRIYVQRVRKAGEIKSQK